MHRSILVAFALLAACGDNNTSSAPPTIADLNLTTDEDTPLTRSIDAADPEGETLTFTLGDPANGTVMITGSSFTYTPDANFNGTDTFTVTASDGTSEASATVTITVTPVNDAPIGVADSFATDEDVEHVAELSALLANDSDVDGDQLEITAVGNASNGSVLMAGGDVTFTPTADFIGNGTYTYTLSDGTVTTDVTVTVTIGGVNDAPVAVDDTAMTDEDVELVITGATLVANDTDAEGQTLTVTSVDNPTHGTVVLDVPTAGDITFTPAANFNGTATFEYTVSDGADTDTGTVTVTVNPINDAPVANDDTATTDEDTPITVTQAVMVGNDTDVDGDSLIVTAAANAMGGTVVFDNGDITFTPDPNTSGTGSFEYTVSDGTLTDTGLVTITINAVNDPPVAVDDTAMTDEDTPVTVMTAALLANDTDTDGGALSITAVGNGTNGSAALNTTTGEITFTPDADFAGTATFDYTVSDGNGGTDTGTVSVTVNPINDSPVAVDDTAEAETSTPTNFPTSQFLANDTDVDSMTLTITSVNNATNGSVMLVGDTITFTSDPGFTGTATFDYEVSDGLDSDTGQVVVTVVPTNTCGDGNIFGSEECDDDDLDPGDGCSPMCQVEPGWTCTGEPSVCVESCGDNMLSGNEECDDGNDDDTDGCTSQCQVGVPFCTTNAFMTMFGDLGQDRVAINPANGHCYVAFDDDMLMFADAQNACLDFGGYLTTITSADENTFVNGVQNATQNPWIGAVDDANDTDDVFDWVTDEAFTFKNFAAGQPDDDAGLGGNGECLHLENAQGEWNDTNCGIATFVVGYICELDPAPCGNGVVQAVANEECDDGNTDANDGCSATCQLEVGCGNGDVDSGEECDDDNLADGDGCSATCQLEDGCGDGNVDPGEECDDDNVEDGDTCSSTCQLLVGCGNGVVDGTETCDDDNTSSFDGCSATCTEEAGAVCSGTAPTVCSKLVINEIDYDQPNLDTAEFVEIYNAGTGPADLTNVALIFVNGANAPAAEYRRILLTTALVPLNALPSGGFIVVGQASVTGAVPPGVFTITQSADFVQNGAPDALALFDTAADQVLDALSYEGSVTAAVLTGETVEYSFTEGTGHAGDPGTAQGLSRRNPNAIDTQDNSTDFSLADVSPGLLNP